MDYVRPRLEWNARVRGDLVVPPGDGLPSLNAQLGLGLETIRLNRRKRRQGSNKGRDAAVCPEAA